MRLGSTSIELMMLMITLRTAPSIMSESAMLAAPVKSSLRTGGFTKAI